MEKAPHQTPPTTISMTCMHVLLAKFKPNILKKRVYASNHRFRVVQVLEVRGKPHKPHQQLLSTSYRYIVNCLQPFEGRVINLVLWMGMFTFWDENHPQKQGSNIR